MHHKHKVREQLKKAKKSKFYGKQQTFGGGGGGGGGSCPKPPLHCDNCPKAPAVFQHACTNSKALPCSLDTGQLLKNP